ncbi:hypothetical protein [Rhodoligotrophos defluvii]|uniref:hypothetical protein n=1 Tax=Rhodoligotrophos defluvii TaxID=2561934 RepID=UPI0010C963D1|nr:hypothetical protein [Rhodoligotrophos defluvii]
MPSIYRIDGTLSANVATNGTFTLGYPQGTNSGTFRGGYGHQLWAGGLQRMLYAPQDFTVAFGASNITVTYKGVTTLPASSAVQLQVDVLGEGDISTYTGGAHNILFGTLLRIDLGAPATADADGVCASQAITAAGSGDINGALAAGGVATFDVPRNVVAAWTNTAVMTVTGTDEYGETLVESSASGTSMTGKKAFKTVTSVRVSADVTGATVGTGDVFGLPVFLPEVGFVLRELEDGGVPTAGTVVAGATAAATATTGDVRGTFDPNSAANGSRAFSLLAFIPDPSYRGVVQYAG